MEFALTDEQVMIQEMASGFLASVSSSEQIRLAMETSQGYTDATWQQLTQELCLHAITIPEQYGGMGLSYVELVTVMEQMGRFLFCAPYFSTVCLAANALLVAATDQQKQQFFAMIIAGKIASVASVDKSGKWTADAVSVSYEKDAGEYILNGEYRYVIDGHQADILVLAAREAGTVGEKGVSMFVVDVNEYDEKNIIRELLPTMDQTRKQASIRLSNLRLPVTACMQEETKAWPLLKKVYQLSCVGLAAEQVGGAQQVLDNTLVYLEERTQFNRKLSSYQVLKHKAADMQLKAEVGRSAIYYAACVAQEALADDGDHVIASELADASSMAKSHCSDTYFYNAGSAMQMHGGVGFTWEYDVHLYFKRAKASQHLLGDGSFHRELIASALLDSPSIA